MRELAVALNMSVSTVSLAMRNDPRVAANTRKRVQNAARKIGYRLNPALTQMMSHVRQSRPAAYRETLAWLDLGETPDRFGPSGIDYLRFMWEGAKERAESLGYLLDSFWMSARGMTGKRMNSILTSRGIRGLLIPPLPRSCGHIPIDWSNFSSVALTHTLLRPAIHRVVPDQHANMSMLLRILDRRGYRRPGLLLSERFDERTGNRFRSAFYFHQNSLPQRDRIPVQISSPESLDEGCIRWLKRHRPDVVITLGKLRHLRNIDIGDAEYSASLGMILLGYATTDAGHAAVDENPREIGATGVDQLVASLSRNERGIPEFPHSISIPGIWIEGETLPVRTQRKVSAGSRQRISVTA